MYKKINLYIIFGLFFTLTKVVFAGPSSSNYELKQYGFGSGGSQETTSTTYGLQSTTGESSTGNSASSTNYSANSGLTFAQNAPIPAAPTLNTSNYYNKIKLTLASNSDPSDTTYAIMASTDNFVSDIRYVQSDRTLGVTYTNSQFYSYSALGGASGTHILGLSPNTTYKFKVSARNGKYGISPYSSASTATTNAPSLTFDIDASATDISTDPPYSITFSLNPGTAQSASAKVWTSLDTNSENGATIYIKSLNSGLISSNTSTTISSVTGDLTALSQGYGIRSTSVSQTSGIITAQTPFNSGSNNVGALSNLYQPIYDTGNAPIVGGRTSFEIIAKANSTMPATTDYQDTITISVSAKY